MASRPRLKGVKKNRHRYRSGPRNRKKRKKSRSIISMLTTAADSTVKSKKEWIERAKGIGDKKIK